VLPCELNVLDSKLGPTPRKVFRPLLTEKALSPLRLPSTLFQTGFYLMIVMVRGGVLYHVYSDVCNLASPRCASAHLILVVSVVAALLRCSSV